MGLCRAKPGKNRDKSNTIEKNRKSDQSSSDSEPHRARIFEAEARVTVAPASRYGMLEASTTYQIYRQAFEDSITQNLSVVGQNPRHNIENITQDREYTNADTKGLPLRRR